MNPFYNIGIKAYALGVKIASVYKAKAKKMLRGQAETFKTLEENIDTEKEYIWFHASSLGEFEQGRPLIEKIKVDYPEAKILLSFFSPSGYEVRKGYSNADVVVYLPFDTPQNVARFLSLVRLKMAIFIKYEFWGNYLQELKRREIPTYIISAIFRPGQVFFRPWGRMFADMLRCYTTIFVQNEESRALLRKIGVENVEISGDTRFDTVAKVRENAKEFPAIEHMTEKSPLTLVMGSSWQPDEDIVIPYFNTHPEVKLIIAPHEFNNERLNAIKARMKRPTSLYTMTPESEAAEVDCLIIDCFGILSSIYRYGQVAYVGGGFGSGIHNVNEAAVYGIPVIFGPKHEKFQEAKDLIACGGAFEVKSAEDFAAVMNKLQEKPDLLRRSGQMSRNYIETHLGATEFIYKNIFSSLRIRKSVN
ncbi:MAG: 3-deoxy-D-manno-octulosonic acid transferase [Muribaculaceae bacterium]|nr:3-deoxy-D-manno-octulosonic acid transferase [Muribaculaceae bacterium]